MVHFNDATREDGRRVLAREVVRQAGFPLWRKLVDKAYAFLSSGVHRDRIALILRTQTPRLPVQKNAHA